MKVYRIKISSWTSSFRYPNIMSGFQPTMEVPPLSTVLGLLNSCSGGYLKHENLNIGYYFEYGTKSIDLETIYMVEAERMVPKNKMKSNVIKREFLYDCNLFVYVSDEQIVDCFKNSIYQVLLGRSSDLATIEEIKTLDLPLIEKATKIKGQVMPLSIGLFPGNIQALPVYFTDTIPRRNLGTQPFSVISYSSNDYPSNVSAYRDVINGKEVDIYFHNINIDNLEIG